MSLKIGANAPSFSLPDQDGKPHSLSDYKGQWVLVYFYPKDDTPGCTKEACAIRDNFPKFKKMAAVVLGISKDSVNSHRKFADKHQLPFTILSDENHEVLKKYDAWGEKSFMGKVFMGIKRISFLIDPNGKIAKIYPKVKPETHADEVLADLKLMQK